MKSLLGSFALNIPCECEASLFNTNIMQIQKIITMQLKYNTNKMEIRALEMPILQDYNTNAVCKYKYNITSRLKIKHYNRIRNTTWEQDYNTKLQQDNKHHITKGLQIQCQHLAQICSRLFSIGHSAACNVWQYSW